jgi:LPXTG-motif cell wall-anchored protein
MLALPAVVAPAATALEAKTATVDSKQVWTNTGVTVRNGQRVAISATGHVHFGLRPIDALPPAGLPWPGCTRVAGSRPDAWPANGTACWSLIARVDDGAVFAVGAGKTIVADRRGTLQLGVNDNELSDNSGSWVATIVVVPLPHTGGGSSTSFAPVAIAAVAVVLLALGVLFALSRRKRRARDREEGTTPVVPAYARPATAVSPGDEDVNIYEVELTDGELRVGYSYFPDGVRVRWRIAANGATAANGEFAAVGGPDRHEVHVPIDADVVHAERAEIAFDWTVGDATFAYAVTRQVV